METTSGDAYYVLGQEYELIMIPPVPEHCVPVEAGPVRFVVESRVLSPEAIGELYAASGKVQRAIPDLNAAGGTLHVFGAEDGLEWLRFDCFDTKPHYHYLRHHDDINQTVRIDDFAIASPITWTVGAVRDRLPEMLAHAGATDVAAAVAADRDTVNAALEEVVALLERARAAVAA